MGISSLEGHRLCLPDGWVTAQLKYICDIIFTGDSINSAVKEKKYKGQLTGYPYIATKDIAFDSVVDYENGVTIPFNNASQFKIAPNNSTLICIEGGSSGRKIGFLKQEVCFGNKLCCIHTSLINSRFLYYYCQAPSFQMLFGDNQKAERKSVTIAQLRELSVIVPPLAEQHRIAAKIDSLFSKMDKGIETLQIIQQQLRTYRQAVLNWAFEGKLTEGWRQFNSYTEKHVFEEFLICAKNECSTINACDINNEFPIYKLPSCWKWVSIGSLSRGIEYGTSAKSEKTGKVVVLRMGNIQNSGLVYDDLAYSNDDIEIEKYLLYKGDVLFNRTNSAEHVGKTAIYLANTPSIFAGYLMRVNQISYINPQYLNYYLNSPNARKCGKIAKTDGVNQANINGKKLAQYPFPLCSADEQKAIVAAIESRLSVCDKLEQIVDENLAKTAALRQSILKKAFEGRLVPQNPNDEPAEKLLERIKTMKTAASPKVKHIKRKKNA